MFACCHRFSVYLTALFLVFFVGCSEEQPLPKLADSVKVAGTLTLDGKPLDIVAIRFRPTTKDTWHGASGISDSEGKYELFTDIGNGKTRPGVIPGTYIVSISRMVKADGSVVSLSATEPPMMSGARDSIPIKYSTENGQIKMTIPPSGGTFDIKLTSK